jgi:hypothetical protein
MPASRVVSVTTRTVGEPATARALVPRRFSRRDLLLGSSSDVLIDDGVGHETGAAGAGIDFRADLKDLKIEPAATRLAAHVVLVTLAVVLLCGAAYLVIDRDRLAAWWRTSSDPATNPPILTTDPLPVPRASEQSLSRARQLFAHRRLREAMLALSPIRVDPLRPDADALLAEIERALLQDAGVTQTQAQPSPPLLSR